MPYTLAHPAAILPLRKIKLFTTAGLVFGAMSPDFEHMIRLNVISIYSHTLLGLFWFCVPLGLLATWTYRKLWRYPAGALFPCFKSDVRPPLWKDAVSVFVGAATHITWDSFTHEGRWGVELLPFLNAQVEIMSGRFLPGWNLLQHASTLLGLVCLALVIGKQTKKTMVAIAVVAASAVEMTVLIWGQIPMRNIIVHSANYFLVLSALALTLGGLKIKYPKAFEPSFKK